MKNLLFSMVVAIFLIAPISCQNSNNEVVPSQPVLTQPATEAVGLKPESLGASLEPMNLAANTIGGGYAFGLPLKTGVNYRISDVVYNSTIAKFVKVEYAWFPAKRLPEPITRTFKITHKTQSEASISGGVSVNGSWFKDIIKATISAVASMTKSKEISDESTMTITVPKNQQCQLEIWEKRKGYLASFWIINVVGNPKTATATNGRLTYKKYSDSVKGSIFEDSYLFAKYR